MNALHTTLWSQLANNIDPATDKSRPRLYRQSLGDPNIYHDMHAEGIPWTGTTATRSELAEMESAGWVVWRVEYVQNWRADGL